MAAFKLAGVALSLSSGMDVCPGCRAARRRGPGSPTRRSSSYIKKIDPSLDLKVVELTSGVQRQNELLASGDVDANYFQHVPYLKDQEKALGKTFAVAATVHIEPAGDLLALSIKISHHCRKTPPWRCSNNYHQPGPGAVHCCRRRSLSSWTPNLPTGHHPGDAEGYCREPKHTEDSGD